MGGMFKYLEKFAKMKNGVGVEVFVNNMDKILDLVLQSEAYKNALAVLIPLGIVLCVVYFCIDIMDRVSHNNFNVETFLRRFMRFLFVYAAVTNIPALLTGTNDFVHAINEQIMVGLNATDSLAGIISNNNDLITSANALRQNATGGMLASINSAVAMLFNLVLQFTTISLGVQRAITIGIKGVLAPIIVPDMFNRGVNSSGMKFLKGLFADYLQTTVLIFLVEMSCIVAFGTDPLPTDNGGIYFLAMQSLVSGIIVAIVLLGAVNKTDEYASQMMEGRVN